MRGSFRNLLDIYSIRCQYFGILEQLRVRTCLRTVVLCVVYFSDALLGASFDCNAGADNSAWPQAVSEVMLLAVSK